MRKVVQFAYVINLNEPRFCRPNFISKDIYSMLAEDVIFKSTDHTKDRKLAKVEDGLSWKTSSKKAGDRLWSVRVESLDRA